MFVIARVFRLPSVFGSFAICEKSALGMGRLSRFAHGPNCLPDMFLGRAVSHNRLGRPAHVREGRLSRFFFLLSIGM